MSNWFAEWRERRRMARKGQIGTRKRRTESLWQASADRSRALMLILAVLLWAVCVTVLMLPIFRQRPMLVAQQLAPSTIFARTDFSYVDREATEQLRHEVVRKQERCYRIAPGREEQVWRNLDALFAAVKKRAELEKKKQLYIAPDLAIDRAVGALGPSAFQCILHLERDPILREEFTNELKEALRGGVLDDSEAETHSGDLPVSIADRAGRNRRPVPLRSVPPYSATREMLTSLLLSYRPDLRVVNHDREALGALVDVLFSRHGNLELDSERTLARREAALAAVEPKQVEVKKNEVIVRRNEPVTERVLDALAAHDAVLAARTQDRDVAQQLSKNIFWSLTLILFAGFYLKNIHPEIMKSLRKAALIVGVMILTLVINYLAVEGFYALSSILAIPPQLVPDALPLALPAVLLAVMLGYRVALYAGFFVSVVCALMLDGSFNVALEGLVLTALAGGMVRKAGNYRAYFIRILLGVWAAVWLLDFDLFWHLTAAPGVLIFTGFLAFGNGLLTAVLALLLVFLFELFFNVSTNMSLMVLCDFNHPLLKELHLKAPGTSQHSQNVAMLAEAAAEEIGANPAKARAGALFHDIGKLKNPDYFVENNFNGESPHAGLSPRMSSIIIGNHVKDGLDLALASKLCREVRDMIQRHHGTSLIQYFYHLAQQQSDGEGPVPESDYRYPGPLPREPEEVIVSLADSCEAACRSLEKPTPTKIAGMVNDIFRARWRDGQLDDALLTVEQLTRIRESFVRTLTTMHHGRIAYPKDENSDNEDKLLMAERPAAGPGAKTAPSGDV